MHGLATSSNLFQLIAVCLLSTEGFQNLKYCVGSKGFLEHVIKPLREYTAYPTVLKSPVLVFGITIKLQDNNGDSQ